MWRKEIIRNNFYHPEGTFIKKRRLTFLSTLEKTGLYEDRDKIIIMRNQSDKWL